MKSKIALSPCPFCGAKPSVCGSRKTQYIYCGGCNAQGAHFECQFDRFKMPSEFEKTELECYAAWNHRVPETEERNCVRSIEIDPPICRCCKRPMGEKRIIEHDELKLRNCPFCGGKAKVAAKETGQGWTFFIECTNCAAHARFVRGDFENRSKLIKEAAFKWNKREADLMGDLEP